MIKIKINIILACIIMVFTAAQEELDESFKIKLDGPCPVIRGRIEPKNMTIELSKLKGIWKTIYDFKRENKENMQIKLESFE